MSVIISRELPAYQRLAAENASIVPEEEFTSAPDLRILLLNLMPTKIETETQLFRVLANSSLKVGVTLLRVESHQTKNTSAEHLERFYRTFSEIKGEYYDGLIITGAPVEEIDFLEVDYWEELTRIMDYSLTNVKSTFHICWGAQAGLYYHYGIPKYQVGHKVFGVFSHRITASTALLRGFDDLFYAPHSRHTEIRGEDIRRVPDLEIWSESPEAGIYIVGSRDCRQVFVTGHSEYDPLTLKGEYDRDISRGLPIQLPVNYFPNDDPAQQPLVLWRAHANLLYTNWLQCLQTGATRP